MGIFAKIGIGLLVILAFLYHAASSFLKWLQVAVPKFIGKVGIPVAIIVAGYFTWVNVIAVPNVTFDGDAMQTYRYQCKTCMEEQSKLPAGNAFACEVCEFTPYFVREHYFGEKYSCSFPPSKKTRAACEAAMESYTADRAQQYVVQN